MFRYVYLCLLYNCLSPCDPSIFRHDQSTKLSSIQHSIIICFRTIGIECTYTKIQHNDFIEGNDKSAIEGQKWDDR